MIVDQLFNHKLIKEGEVYDLGREYGSPSPAKKKRSQDADDHNPYPHSREEDDDYFREIFRRKREAAKKAGQSKLDESMLLEDPVYRNFKRIGRYIAERKLTEPEILKVFADAETGMTDKATGANRTFLGRGKDTAMDFAGGVADALKGVWSGLQSSVPVSAVDVAYDQATDALGNLVGGEKGAVMSAIKKYRELAKQYPKTAGLAKGVLVAITGLATGGAGLPAAAALIYGLDSAIKGEKFSDIVLKAGGAAAIAWAAGKIASLFGGDQAAAGAEAGGMGDPSQLPPFDDAGNLAPGFHINPEDGIPYYNGELAPTPADIAAGYGPGGAEATAGAARFDDIVANAVDYKIKDGDTLSQILADKKINPEAFKRLPGNETYFGPEGNPDVIKAGQTIKLPRPEDIADLNKMSYTTPDAAGGNLQRFLDDPNYYTGQYNPNNSRFSLDAATNLKQQELGRYAASDIAANRVAQDAARAGGGPELLGGPAAGDVAQSASSQLPPGVVQRPSLNIRPGDYGPASGDNVFSTNAFNREFAAMDAEIAANPGVITRPTPADVRPFGSGAPDTSLLGGVTSQNIYNSPVYQQAYAQEIARYGAEPSARAIQSAQQIATLKAKAAMAGAVKESAILRNVKLRRLPVSELFDQKLTTLAWALNESVGKPQGNSVHLTSRGVNVVFENVDRYRRALLERIPSTQPGPGREQLPDYYRPDASEAPVTPDPKPGLIGRGLNALDRGVKAVGGALGTVGRQFTSNVTKEKLKMNWHLKGKPSDSDQLFDFLRKQGVPIGVVNDIYKKMGLPVRAEPTAPTAPTDPQARSGGAQKSMPFYGTNPATGKAWTYDELQAKANAGKVPVTDTPTNTEPAPTTTTTTTSGGPGAGAFGNMASQLASRPTTSSTGGTTTGVSGVGGGVVRHSASATNPNQPKPVTPTSKPAADASVPSGTAELPAGGGAGIKAANPFGSMASSLTKTDEPAAAKVRIPSRIPKKAPVAEVRHARRIAEALTKPVEKMLRFVETTDDVKQIKQFIDQTFVKYGAVNESAFAIRNQILEHVTQVGAQRRREHSQSMAH